MHELLVELEDERVPGIKGNIHPKSLLGQPLKVVIRMASLFQVPYGLLTKGHNIILYDSQGDDALALREFPGPREIRPYFGYGSL